MDNDQMEQLRISCEQALAALDANWQTKYLRLAKTCDRKWQRRFDKLSLQNAQLSERILELEKLNYHLMKQFISGQPNYVVQL